MMRTRKRAMLTVEIPFTIFQIQTNIFSIKINIFFKKTPKIKRKLISGINV
jgi:hypothetical protein